MEGVKGHPQQQRIDAENTFKVKSCYVLLCLLVYDYPMLNMQNKNLLIYYQLEQLNELYWNLQSCCALDWLTFQFFNHSSI